jgi:hypothetical protein
MKTPKQNGLGFHLQMSNNRWKWMAGATAATAAGVSASQGSTITINLVGNSIGALGIDGGNNLNADLTGDGHPDLTIANISNGYYFAGVTLNGVRAYVSTANDGAPDNFAVFMTLGSQRAAWYLALHYYSGGITTTRGTRTLMGSIPIFFKDLHINGGAPTRGALQVTVSPYEIDLDSLTYTSNTAVEGAIRTVPDQGSSLALLAMGAGGIVALRRWRAKKGSNPQLPA